MEVMEPSVIFIRYREKETEPCDHSPQAAARSGSKASQLQCSLLLR